LKALQIDAGVILGTVQVQRGNIFAKFQDQESIVFANDGSKLFENRAGVPIGSDQPRGGG
jgi:hypothetical protein